MDIFNVLTLAGGLSLFLFGISWGRHWSAGQGEICGRCSAN